MSEIREETAEKDLIRLHPFGIDPGQDGSRPTLLLKDESQNLTLLVPVSPIEAAITLSQHNLTVMPASPHRFVEELLRETGMKIKDCVFTEMKPPHQYVRVRLSGHKTVKSLRVRADEVMSLCLQLEAPIYASRSFIQRSRSVNAEMDAARQMVQQIPQPYQRPHPYLM